MSTEKWVARLEAKIDALLEESGLDPTEFDQPLVGAVARARRERTPQEQQAIANAPQVTPAVNAKANAPANAAPPAPAIPSDAVGKGTVETKQPGGERIATRTMSAQEARSQGNEQARQAETQARAAQQQAIDNAPPAPAADQSDQSGQQSGEPWAGYDEASAEQVIETLRGMDAAARDKALTYERQGKNRVTITRVNWNS